MKKLFILGSTIHPRMDKDFTYSRGVRSHFKVEERLRMTISSVISIKNNFPDADIVVVDASVDSTGNNEQYFPMLGAEFVSLTDIDPEATEFINSYDQKSSCECKLLYTYMSHAREKLLSYDYIIKGTGRYHVLGMTEKDFSEENKDKILFKKPNIFEWTDAWQYDFIDRRHVWGDNLLRQYCTVIYAFGVKHLDRFLDIYKAGEHLLKHPKMRHYDIESLSYYLTRPYADDIVETDWRVCGWDGVGGNLVYY